MAKEVSKGKKVCEPSKIRLGIRKRKRICLENEERVYALVGAYRSIELCYNF